MKETILCPESLPYLGLTVLLGFCVYWITPWLLLPVAILLGFLLWFFRNPNRRLEAAADELISPADGQVMSVTEVDDEFVGEKAQKITIFLSVFNVHVNRTPAEGTIRYKKYHPGKFLPAYKPHAAEENERCTLGIEAADGFRYKVRQITGILARRIVNDYEEGVSLKRGQRFGMIKFGSCTELLVPRTAKVLVKPGDKLRGVRSIVAKKG